MRMETTVSSGFVTPPSHSPVNGSLATKGVSVGVGAGEAIGAAQAVSKQIKTRDRVIVLMSREYSAAK